VIVFVVVNDDNQYVIVTVDDGMALHLLRSIIYIESGVSENDDREALNHHLLPADQQQQGISNLQVALGNDSSIDGIVRAYCRIATDAAGEAFRMKRSSTTFFSSRSGNGYVGYFSKVDKEKGEKIVEEAERYLTISKVAANKAIHIVSALRGQGKITSRSATSSALAAAAMWEEARNTLRSLHVDAVKEAEMMAVGMSSIEETNIKHTGDGVAVREIQMLHRSLMKLCARAGNATAALWYIDDMREYLSNINHQDATSRHLSELGISAESWKLLAIAASKAGQWEVCADALRSLQPFIEATHPRFACNDDGDPSPQKLRHLNNVYNGLVRSLTATVLSFETAMKVEQAVRAIDDWIEWTGRRPPVEAVSVVSRTLAACGLEDDVRNLIQRVIRFPYLETDREESWGRQDNEHANDVRNNMSNRIELSYQEELYASAIGVLHSHGLYNNADGLYNDAVTAGYFFLPTVVTRDSSEESLTLDLHGLSLPVAHSAVRVSLQDHMVKVQGAGGVSGDVIIVTGRGKRSSKKFRPVLRPEVQRMLQEEFFPPMGTMSIPDNMGALRVLADDVNGWIYHQQQEKQARLQLVANMLSDISSGTKLKKIIIKGMKK